MPDLNAAARYVLQDWNGGKIQYYTEPPDSRSETENVQIVGRWSAEFNLDEILRRETAEVISGLAGMDISGNAMSMGVGSMASAIVELPEEEEGYDDGDDDDDYKEEEEDEMSDGDSYAISEPN